MTAQGLDHLTPAWREAFGQAWASFGGGNYGVGAVLTDPDREHRIVSAGRNLVVTPPADGQPLGGNYIAHAEMNAYAALAGANARGLHLTTTLQPCLMCAATGIFLHVGSVEYDAADEYFDELDDQLWTRHPYTRERRPPTSLALDGPVSEFARLLPTIHMLATIPDGTAADVARTDRPTLAALAESAFGGELRGLAAAGVTVDVAFDAVTEALDGR